MKTALALVAVLALVGLPSTCAAEPAKPPTSVATETIELVSGELDLIAPRDGYASGSAAVRGRKIAGVAVTPPRLTGPDGAVLPAEAIQVRWLSGDQFTTTPVVGEYREGRAVLGQQQSIVLTVHAPKAAAAGVYTGRLGVTCEGFSGELPVALEVMPWVVPAPRDRHMLTGLIHSPDTIALQYKVEPWSDTHLKYMEPSLRLLNDLGSESCQVYLIAEGIINERYSMVRRRTDGTPDFTCMDRYLDLWQRVCGPPKKLTLYLWDQNESDPPVHWSATNSVKVTQIKAEGTLENIPAPYYGMPGSKAFWQPVFDGIRERLAQRGWKETEVLLGIPGDQQGPKGGDGDFSAQVKVLGDKQPQRAVVSFLQDVAPGWRWRMFAYGIFLPFPGTDGKLVLNNGLEVGWLEGVAPLAVYPTKRMQGGPPADIVRAAALKRSYPLTVGCNVWSWSDAVTLAVERGAQGLSQVGLDFWAIAGEKGKGTFELMRKGPNQWAKNPNRDLARTLTTPGPNGAEPGLSYDMLREGMQVAEAFVQVRDHDPRLPEEVRFLATEAAETFDALVHCRMLVPSGRQAGTWNAAVRELYRMADVLQTTARFPVSAPELQQPVVLHSAEIGGLRLVAPRDGYASTARASLVGQQLTGISAAPPRLTGPRGAVLPAEAVQVHWLTDDNVFTPRPVDGKRQDMILSVHPPKDATPGVYTGSLKVNCQGFEGAVPIRFEIMPYVMPAPKDWPMLTGFIHSPDAIARQYKVEPWSDAHLKYMESSLRLLRDIGSESCQVFLIADGLLNERYSMVRRRADGAPDFSCMDRYLDLWQRVCGQPKYITLYTWDGNQYKRGAPAYSPAHSVLVTRVNADGTLENIRAPYYGTPAARAFWQPVFDGIRERLVRRGWQDSRAVLGVPWDSEPQEEVVVFLKEVAPAWHWRVYTHGYGKPLPNAEGRLVLGCGLEVDWFEGVGAASHLGKWPNMVKGFLMKRLYPFTDGNRGIYPIGHPSTAWRDGPTHDLFYGSQGISQIGLDYWFSLNCWTGLGGNPRDNLVESITTPGLKGAEASLGYELLREGLQTAAVYRETKDRCADLSKEERTKALGAVQAFESIIAGRMAWQDPIATSQRRWNAAVRELFRVAGDVQAATQKKD